MDLFSAKDAPKSMTMEGQMKEWIKTLRNDQRAVERDIQSLERQEAKVKTDIKKAVTNNRLSVVRIMAKELIHSRKAKERLYVAKANLNSISLQIQNQIGMCKISKNVKLGSDVMRQMNQIMNVGQISQNMRNLSKEMMRAGVVEEMIGETFEVMDDESGVTEEADEEVAKIINEIVAEIGQTSVAKGKSKSKENAIATKVTDPSKVVQ